MSNLHCPKHHRIPGGLEPEKEDGLVFCPECEKTYKVEQCHDEFDH